MQINSIGGQSLQAIAAGDFAAQNGANNAVSILNRQGDAHGLFVFQIAVANIQQLTHIEGFFQLVVLLFGANLASAGLHLGLIQQRGQIQIFVLPVTSLFRLRNEHLGATHHLVDGAEAQHGHVFTHLLRDKAHVVNDVFRLAAEVLAQRRVLGSNTHGAGVQVTYAHHHAANGNQGRGGKAVLLCTQQGGDDYVATGEQLAVGFQGDAVTQVVQKQGLMGLHQAQLPGQTCVVDRGARGRTGTTVVAANEHNVGAGLNYACSNGTNAHLANQLHADAGTGVGVLQIVNQLGQVLDGVYIMMGRR